MLEQEKAALEEKLDNQKKDNTTMLTENVSQKRTLQERVEVAEKELANAEDKLKSVQSTVRKGLMEKGSAKNMYDVM